MASLTESPKPRRRWKRRGIRLAKVLTVVILAGALGLIVLVIYVVSRALGAGS